MGLPARSNGTRWAYPVPHAVAWSFTLNWYQKVEKAVVEYLPFEVALAFYRFHTVIDEAKLDRQPFAYHRRR